MALPPAHTGFSFVGMENLHNDIYPSVSASQNLSLHQPGKVVLITGAGRGIGRSIALQYAHASISTIVLCARTGTELDAVEDEIMKINIKIKILKFTLDVTSSLAVQDCATQVEQYIGRLDVLVNNAGTSDPWVPIHSTDPTTWWTTIEVNLKGPYLLCQAFLPLLISTAQENSTTVDVLNMSSIGAHMVAPGASAYQVSKLAVVRLTDFLDVEYKDKGVNAIALHPGGVITNLSKDNEAIRPYLTDTPDLCGGFVVWLTARARTWLAGRYVSVTWDVNKLESMKDGIIKDDKLKVRMAV